jgi:hypothetical protein
MPKPKPRISRDRTAVVLAVIAVTSFLVAIPLDSWIKGRLNWETESLLATCFLVLAHFVAGLVLLIRVVSRFVAGTPVQRICWILLVALLPLPYLVLMSGIPPAEYKTGFASWTRANVDAKAIRQWATTVPIDTAQGIEYPPAYWLGVPLPQASFVPVAKADWPACIARARAKEVYVLSDRSAVVLHWPAGGRDWSRSIVIAADETSPPPQGWPFENFGQGVWACVRGPT